ncbi:MAG TPA: PRC and DUF2382 domain-containing protein [Jiangellales bacterium]|nr:PRC and DUF2382 domain-containing protein [Jiangellales bacterium]
MITTENVRDIVGATVYGSDGEKIGKVGQVYLDDATGQPEWVSVNTGLFGTSESFVPLADARITGDRVEVSYSKGQVKDAPRVDADEHLSEEEEEMLYRHYGLGGRATGRGTGGEPRRGTVGRDTSGPTTDEAMTRSEEHLRVGTENREAGRARLRKYVVTEQEQVDVPVTREEVRVEREPITDANRGSATSGPAISEEEHEVVLHEERPVVDTEAVPVERVRLDKETVTDQEKVAGDVRKERIDTDVPDRGERRR